MSRGLIVLAAASVLLAACGAASPTGNPAAAATPAADQGCTVRWKAAAGVTPTTLTFTFAGRTATAQCGLAVYEPIRPAPAVVCRFVKDGLTQTIRDTTASSPTGKAICQANGA